MLLRGAGSRLRPCGTWRGPAAYSGGTTAHLRRWGWRAQRAVCCAAGGSASGTAGGDAGGGGLGEEQVAPAGSSEDASAEAAKQLVKQLTAAGSGEEVAALLLTAARGAAGASADAAILISAALDRLRAVHAARPRKWERDPAPDVRAAYELALSLCEAWLTRASPRLLKTLARTTAALGYRPPAGEEEALAARLRDITNAFVPLMEQDLGAALVRQLQRQQQQQLGGAGNGSSSGGDGSEDSDQTARELVAFATAALGGEVWCVALSPKERRGLLWLVWQHGTLQSKDNVALLCALAQMRERLGPRSLDGPLRDGSVRVIVDRAFAGLEGLKPQPTHELLRSLALLRYPLAPARLSALLEHQAATAKGGRAGENIAKTFEAWALLHAVRPPAAAAVAAGAGVRSRGALALARAFAALVERPDSAMDPEEWSRVFRACADMGYDPLLAGPGGPRLLGVLLPKLPDLAPRCSPLDAVDALLGLATRYGVPAEGRLPRALAPYHETLGALGSVALRAAASPKGQAALTAPGVQTVVEAFAALGGPRQGQAQGQRQGQGQGQGPTRARAGGPGQRQGPAGVRAGGPGLGQGRRRPPAAGHNTPAAGQKAAGRSTPAAGQKAAGHNTPAAGHKTAKKSV